MSQKKITIILQARTGSKRFPRKVLAKIEILIFFNYSNG